MFTLTKKDVAKMKKDVMKDTGQTASKRKSRKRKGWFL